MKRRVGRYKNTILVEGDKNEFKPHEKSIDNIGGGNEEITPIIKYYKLVEVSPLVGAILEYVITCIINKQEWNRYNIEHSYDGDYTNITAFSVISNSPIPSPKNALMGGILTFEEFVTKFAEMGQDMTPFIQEITKEEYHNLINE